MRRFYRLAVPHKASSRRSFQINMPPALFHTLVGLKHHPKKVVYGDHHACCGPCHSNSHEDANANGEKCRDNSNNDCNEEEYPTPFFTICKDHPGLPTFPLSQTYLLKSPKIPRRSTTKMSR